MRAHGPERGPRWLGVVLGPWSFSVLSGLLLTASFPRINWGWVAWLALVPLLLAVRRQSFGESFRLGYVCGLVHYVSTLYWIEYVVQHYGGVPLPPAIGILALLCAYLALYPAVFAVLARLWSDRPFYWVLGLPAVWVVLEFLRAHALTGFPWASLGYSQTPFLPMMQSADIWGVYGVSWLVVFANVCLTARGLRRPPLPALCCFGACLLLVLGYGFWRLDRVRALDRTGAPWSVAVVQGNIEEVSKWDPAYQNNTIERYQSLSEQAAASEPRPQLMVWPETCLPFFYGLDPEPTARVDKIIQALGVPVIFGSPGVTLKQGRMRLLNKAFLVDAMGRVRGDYAKRHLVPFGEYVPWPRLLFFVHRLVPAAGDFIPGDSSRPLVVNGERVGVLICYEAVFPALARASVQAGANVLVNITNDAWFGDSSAPYQHLEMSRWRAVENRVPLVRAANTGISALIEPTGEVVETLPLDVAGHLNGAVKRIDCGSFYSRCGDVFAWICCLTAATMVLSWIARRRLGLL